MDKKKKKVTNKENNGKDNKNKKSFFKGLKAELKRVIWPTPKQLVNNTIAVITIVLITAIIVFILDFAFESLNKYGVDKIKESVQTMQSTTSENSNATENQVTDETSENQSNTENMTEETSENQLNTENATDETTEENQNNSENNAE